MNIMILSFNLLIFNIIIPGLIHPSFDRLYIIYTCSWDFPVSVSYSFFLCQGHIFRILRPKIIKINQLMHLRKGVSQINGFILENFDYTYSNLLHFEAYINQTSPIDTVMQCVYEGGMVCVAI